MTEEEVKTKWCPMTRIVDIEGGISNKPSQDPHDNKCIASDCAMWKWKMTPKDAAMLNKIGKEQEPQGYCGLTRGE